MDNYEVPKILKMITSYFDENNRHNNKNLDKIKNNNNNEITKKKNIRDKYFQYLKYTNYINDTACKSNCYNISFNYTTSNEEINKSSSNIMKNQITNYNDYDSCSKVNKLEDMKYENEFLKVDKEKYYNNNKPFKNFVTNKKLCDIQQEKQKTNLISCYKYNNLKNKNDFCINKKYNTNDIICDGKYIVKYKTNSFILNEIVNKNYNLCVNNSSTNIKKYNMESAEDVDFCKLYNEEISNTNEVPINEYDNHSEHTRNNIFKSENMCIRDITQNDYTESTVLNCFAKELYNTLNNNKNYINNENKQKLNAQIDSKNAIDKNSDEVTKSHIDQKFNQLSKCFIKFSSNDSYNVNKNINITNVITKIINQDNNNYNDNYNNNDKYEYNDLTNNIEHLAILKNKNTYILCEKEKSNELFEANDKTYLKMINNHFRGENNLESYNINKSFLYIKNTCSKERNTLNSSEKKYFQSDNSWKTIINKKIYSDPLLSSNIKSLMGEFHIKKSGSNNNFDYYINKCNDTKNRNKIINKSQIIETKMSFEFHLRDQCFNKWKKNKKKKKRSKNKGSIKYYKNIKILNDINKKSEFLYETNASSNDICNLKCEFINYNKNKKSHRSNSCFFLSAHNNEIFNILKFGDFPFTSVKRNRSLEDILSNRYGYINKVFSLSNAKIKKHCEYYGNGIIFNFYRNKIFGIKENESTNIRINNNSNKYYHNKCKKKYYNKYSLKNEHSKSFCEVKYSFMKNQFNKIRRKFLFKNIRRKKLKKKKKKKKEAYYIYIEDTMGKEHERRIYADRYRYNDNKYVCPNDNNNERYLNFQRNYNLANNVNQKKYSLIIKKCLVQKKRSSTYKNKFASFSYKTKRRCIDHCDNVRFTFPIKKKEFMKNKKKSLAFLKLKHIDKDVLNKNQNKKRFLYNNEKADYKNNANVLNTSNGNRTCHKERNTKFFLRIQKEKKNEFINSVRDVEREKGNNHSKNWSSFTFNCFNISSKNENSFVQKNSSNVASKSYVKIENILKSNTEDNDQNFYGENIYLENIYGKNENISKEVIRNGDTAIQNYLSYGTSIYSNNTKVHIKKDEIKNIAPNNEIMKDNIKGFENKNDNKKKLYEVQNYGMVEEKRKKIKKVEEIKKYYIYKKKKKFNDTHEKETTILNEQEDINKKKIIFNKHDEIYRKKQCIFANNSIPYMKDNYKSVYYIVGLIYYGKKSQVYKCINTIDKKMYAMKIVSKELNDIDVNNFMKKYLFLKNNPHKNIIAIHDIFSDKNYNCIIMELCEGPTLLDYFMSLVPGSISVYEIKQIMKNIFLALDFFHSKNIIHRDIKFENIMFKKKRKRIFDYEGYGSYILDDSFSYEMDKFSYIEPREKMKKNSFQEHYPFLIKNNILLNKNKSNRTYNNSVDIINYEVDSYASLFYDRCENSNFQMDSDMEFSNKEEICRNASMDSLSSFHSEISMDQYYSFKHSYSLSEMSNNCSNTLLLNRNNKSLSNIKKSSFTKLQMREEKDGIFKKIKCRIKKKRKHILRNFFRDLCLIDMDMIEIVSTNKEFASKKSDVICGTAPYMPPESLDGIISTGNDIWACGVILYALMDGHFPFEINNNMPIHLKKKILTQNKPNFDPLVWQDHPEILDLCLRLLDPNPLTRIQNAREALIHYCFSNII